MMQADYPVLLDACVLVPIRLCDLLLKLAEHPRLYLPKWSETILDEVHHAQCENLNPPFPTELADYWRAEVQNAFPEAMIDSFDHLIEKMENDKKDRHVLAAAVHDNISTIVTFNLKDFKAEHLGPWNVEAQHPQDFLLNLYSLQPTIVLGKLAIQADHNSISQAALLNQLRKTVPLFTSKVQQDLGFIDSEE